MAVWSSLGKRMVVQEVSLALVILQGELGQGGLGNINKGKLKNGREDSQVSGCACRTAD